ncbi:MAG: copper homeostasis membrane protein CopD [Rhodocyclaceae bacterium]|nr:copper homeostasis membrane protein CopD [Rhodocyclaceae bacterium]
MDFASTLIRLGLYLDLGILFGLAFFAMYALSPDEMATPFGRRLRSCVTTFATLGIALSLLNVVVMAKNMSGADSYAEIEMHMLSMIVSGTDFGLAWIWRMTALLACLGFVWTTKSGRSTFLCIGAGVAMATLAWAGHAVMDTGMLRYEHLGVDIAHLLAAATWAGALTAFLMLSRNVSSAALFSRTTNGFAQIGSILVGVLVVTGAINYWLIVGPKLADSLYGLLLLVKLALFGLMLGLAAINRFRLAPKLEAAVSRGDREEAMLALRRSIVIEASAATLIFAFVAYLGLQSPSSV